MMTLLMAQEYNQKDNQSFRQSEPCSKVSSFELYKKSLSQNVRRSNFPKQLTSRHRMSSPPTYPVICSSRVRANWHVYTTRRILVMMMLLIISIGVLIFPATKAFGRRSLVSPERIEQLSSNNTTRIVVKPGDSLWSIAKVLEPKQDPRKTVDQIIKARGTSRLNSGEIIEWVK